MGAAEVLKQLAELAERACHLRPALSPAHSEISALASLKRQLPFDITEIKMLTPWGCCACAEPCAQVKGTR